MNRLGFFRIIRSLRGTMLRYMPLMITCRQFEDFIIDYLEGDLPDRQRTMFELHLKLCSECRNYLAAYKRAVGVSAKAADTDEWDENLPEVPEDLVKAILTARKLGG